MKRIIVLIVMCFNFILLKAHPVSISWVNGRISETQLVLSYRILAEDLTFYYKPSINEAYDYSVTELKSLAMHHRSFFEQNFIPNADGQKIVLKDSKVIGNSLPDALMINIMDLMKYEVTYQVTYNIDSNWKFLSFRQRFLEVKDDLPTVCYLTLNDGPIVLVENQEITSEPFVVFRDSPVKPLNPSMQTSSYFTTNMKGIYHELTIPFESLIAIMGIPIQSEINPITIDRFLQNSQNQVVADGENLKVKCSDFILLTKKKNSMVYLNLFYPFVKLPKKMELTWADYNWNLRWFDSQIKTMNSNINHRFTRYQPTISLNESSSFEKKD
ncbi:MAG: hypothetical protein JXR07_19450 [Reichenbachiella sp.]